MSLSDIDRKICAMQKIIEIQKEQLNNNINYLIRLKEEKNNITKLKRLKG